MRRGLARWARKGPAFGHRAGLVGSALTTFRDTVKATLRSLSPSAGQVASPTWGSASWSQGAGWVPSPSTIIVSPERAQVRKFRGPRPLPKVPRWGQTPGLS